ncbi:AraC family ligand binding domain-containing protein [Paenibacillus hamazuiensis]|uniref:AraC family ligand binding domain-containing protein n=1 Tax=Paenibacillus hamazuiensis TaxID=2936508 RepID=UPI00200EFFD5|nr:AraC family ligand binding domain-containing protein [Paenibacillus hamazuiensis]
MLQNQFAESLHVTFLHIREYDLDHTWAAADRELAHSVLWCVRDGKFSLQLSGNRYNVEAGDFALLPAGAEISYRAASTAVRLVSINFDASVTLLPDRSWTELLSMPVRYPEALSGLEAVLADMLHASGTASAGQNLLLQSGLLRILSALLDRQPVRRTEPGADGMDRRILGVIEYVAAHPALMPDTAQLAELAQVSESHLRKLFMDHTGLSPTRFIHRLK